MRERIKARFNIDFKGGNPFYFLIKAQAKARIKPKMGHLSARCFGGCGRLFDGYNLVSRRFSPYNVCEKCCFVKVVSESTTAEYSYNKTNERVKKTAIKPDTKKTFLITHVRLRYEFVNNKLIRHDLDFELNEM